MSNTYNGWTNYATWRINLEIFDGLECDDIGVFSRYSTPDISDVVEWLQQYAEDVVFMDCPNSLAVSYARAFMDGVNYYEIAQHYMDEWQEQMDEEERDEEESEAE
jgi:hypothetical protein